MNPHDIAAARIVAGAMDAKRMPPAARGAVSAALAMAGAPLATQQPEAANQPSTGPAAPDPREELARMAAQQMSTQYDGIIRSLLQQRHAAGEIETADPHALEAAGTLKAFRFEDGTSEYELAGKRLVTFWPPAVAFEDGDMLVQLQYRLGL